MREQRRENRLRDVVASRGELVEDQVFARHVRAILVGRFFDVVDGTRDEGVVGDAPPV
jgi:hypothetical protein